MVIDLHAVRRLAESARGNLVIDCRGAPIEVGGLPDESPVPGLLVGNVNEAIKQIAGGKVVHHLNRDMLWGVEGFVLDRVVISSLADGVDSAAHMIEAVQQAGFEWQTIVLSPRS